MTYYRTVKVPRTGCHLPAHWKDDDMLFIIPRFSRLSDAQVLHAISKEKGLDPSELCTDSGKFVETASDEEIRAAEYFDFILSLEGQEALRAWAIGDDLCDDNEGYPIFDSLAEVIR